jgi:hypothetical protein
MMSNTILMGVVMLIVALLSDIIILIATLQSMVTLDVISVVMLSVLFVSHCAEGHST